jgi:hypothetical protein
MRTRLLVAIRRLRRHRNRHDWSVALGGEPLVPALRGWPVARRRP